jgi:hypothetical protein
LPAPTTRIPAAWLAAANRALEPLQLRVEQVKREHNAALSARAQWGDVSIRWQQT